MIRLKLQSVTFSGANYHGVLRDTNGVAYAPPHWTANYSAPVSYTCFNVTWEVVTNGSGGEPTVAGGTVAAGTNCGRWTVIARSTVNSNCADSATITVVRVEDLSPGEGTLVSLNPPT